MTVPDAASVQLAFIRPGNPVDILERAQNVFQEVLDQPELRLTPSLTVQDVQGWDSLNHVRLIMGLEREFGIRMKASEIVKAACVGDLLKIIADKSTR